MCVLLTIFLSNNLYVNLCSIFRQLKIFYIRTMADVVDVEHSGSSGSSESSSNRLTTQNSNGRAASPSALTRTGSASSSSHNADPFRAYGYFAEYQRRKEIRLKIMQREEREQRKHKALPMPNFKAIHLRAASKEPTVPYHSSPVTPDVLKRGLAMMDKARRKVSIRAGCRHSSISDSVF